MIMLGIETSCDETAAAVVQDSIDPSTRILSNVVQSQHRQHRPFGGIVPEIAARSHLQHVDEVINAAMSDAAVGFGDLDGVAATGGPGLIGGVIVGVTSAKGIALARDIPFLAINHLAGHALTARLTHDVDFPYLLLLVSGGHTQLLIVNGVADYERLGTTVDDAVGEAFDKSAKLLGLGYPGGPEIEKEAIKGDPRKISLPRPMKGRDSCNFSFSGLKTALRNKVRELRDRGLDERDIENLCASFQAAVADVMADRSRRAAEVFKRKNPEGQHLVVAGGVAANLALRGSLEKVALQAGLKLIAPPPALCTDNGAMIAWAGLERMAHGLTSDLAFAPRPRWPLDPRAPAVGGAGVKA